MKKIRAEKARNSIKMEALKVFSYYYNHLTNNTTINLIGLRFDTYKEYENFEVEYFFPVNTDDGKSLVTYYYSKVYLLDSNSLLKITFSSVDKDFKEYKTLVGKMMKTVEISAMK